MPRFETEKGGLCMGRIGGRKRKGENGITIFQFQKIKILKE